MERMMMNNAILPDLEPNTKTDRMEKNKAARERRADRKKIVATKVKNEYAKARRARKAKS